MIAPNTRKLTGGFLGRTLTQSSLRQPLYPLNRGHSLDVQEAMHCEEAIRYDEEAIRKHTTSEQGWPSPEGPEQSYGWDMPHGFQTYHGFHNMVLTPNMVCPMGVRP